MQHLLNVTVNVCVCICSFPTSTHYYILHAGHATRTSAQQVHSWVAIPTPNYTVQTTSSLKICSSSSLCNCYFTIHTCLRPISGQTSALPLFLCTYAIINITYIFTCQRYRICNILQNTIMYCRTVLVNVVNIHHQSNTETSTSL